MTFYLFKKFGYEDFLMNNLNDQRLRIGLRRHVSTQEMCPDETRVYPFASTGDTGSHQTLKYSKKEGYAITELLERVILTIVELGNFVQISNCRVMYR